MMKKLLLSALAAAAMTLTAQAQSATKLSSNLVAEEGAWCWFADPRALHYENENGTINATYIGYIDVHGNVKATQYDWVKKHKTDVLIRSYFQPDDHNNPTFVVLPDERVMIFYTRHTDEPKIWYRISRKPGDITDLGEEKYLATANNTTYPSPFIMSDDPQHIYLCWRGINWHPTIARLTMPDANDNCGFDFGPKQIVQSTGARPYAKYQSNGKDKIYVSYTTGHPDNEMPDWLYFNVIDINNGNGPILRDLKGKQLSVINNGVFNVNKTDSYANSYPATIVDKTANTRNWVWQIALDKNENPVIAHPHIDDAKTSHAYWYSRWNGTKWTNIKVADGGHAFHQNWNSTERCYSGGMALDPDNINDLYLSIPTTNGAFNRNGVYEIWKYTISDDGKVGTPIQITANSSKNNARPYVIPGSKNSPLRLAWMQGDYYYWMVKQGYPKGYPTLILADHTWEEDFTAEADEKTMPRTDCLCLAANKTLNIAIAMDAAKYTGTLFTMGESVTYAIDNDFYPVVTIAGKGYRSQNRLLTSDDWATNSNGTSGDNHPTKLTTWILSMTYDGDVLTTYRNGLVDQVIEVKNLQGGTANFAEDRWQCKLDESDYYACASPVTVQKMVEQLQANIEAEKAARAIGMLSLPDEVRTDMVLPTEKLGLAITWKSSNPDVLTDGGIAILPKRETKVTLTATIGNQSKDFDVNVLPRNVEKNIQAKFLFDGNDTGITLKGSAKLKDGKLDLTANTAGGFATNGYAVVDEGLLDGLRSYTVLLTVTPSSLTNAPRLYDFGGNSGNSVFLRANALSAGVKLGGGTTTMVDASTQLATGKEQKLAVTFDAATKTTKIYVDGEEKVSGTANQNEPYMVFETAGDARNYIGRTQWWDSNYASSNVDFIGTIDNFVIYDIALTQKEVCDALGISFQEKEYSKVIQNADFEDTYSVMPGCGVSSDRAIYVPKFWTVDYGVRNENDFSAMKSGDLYYDQFFAGKPQNAKGGSNTLWVRQRWGSSSISYYQEVQLEEGDYELAVDMLASDTSGKTCVFINKTQKSVSEANVWQTLKHTFSADGTEVFKIGFMTTHADSDNERISAFDNLSLMLNVPISVGAVDAKTATPTFYSLSGTKINTPKRGVSIAVYPDGTVKKVMKE